MKKKWIQSLLIGASLLSLSFASLQAEEFFSTGREIIWEIEAQYRAGSYDPFLKQLHEQYARAGKAGVLRGIVRNSKGLNPSPPKTVAAVSKSEEEIKEQAKKLTAIRNEELKKVIEEAPLVSTPIIEQAKEVISFSQETEEQKELEALSKIKYKEKIDADILEESFDKKIAVIETQYEIKSHLLDIAALKTATPPQTSNPKKIALELEKFKKMQALAEAVQSHPWQEKIQKAKSGYMAKEAYKVNMGALRELAEERRMPQNAVEEKIKQIMVDYLRQNKEYQAG